jgi:hypothetical protein
MSQKLALETESASAPLSLERPLAGSRQGTRDSIASAADKQRAQRCTASASARAQSISRAFQNIYIYIFILIFLFICIFVGV